MYINKKNAAVAGITLLAAAGSVGGAYLTDRHQDAIEAQKASHLEVIVDALGPERAEFWLAYDAGTSVSNYPLPSDMEQQMAKSPSVAAAREAIHRIDKEKRQHYSDAGMPIGLASAVSVTAFLTVGLPALRKLRYNKT